VSWDRSVWSDHSFYDSFRQAEREEDVYERYGSATVSWRLSSGSVRSGAARPKTVRERVRYLLEEYPETRNSDLLLTILYLREFTDLRKFVKPIPYTLIKKHEEIIESVRRARQLIQAGGEYLPTDPEVLERRKKKERKLRKLLEGGGGDS